MAKRFLLYGATGYSGRLIAAEAARRWGNRTNPGRSCELVLASRDRRALAELAEDLKLDYRAFSLDYREPVVRALHGFDVLINAAGPFDQTAERLAKSALDAGCHYVDINGEVDVYKRLDDLHYFAQNRGLALVCGAGHTATLSDLMLDTALHDIPKDELAGGIARIAVARMKYLSRGSARTMMRMVREQVTVARTDPDSETKGLVLSHVPVGKLERSFDFGGGEPKHGSGIRIASAANLIDTLAARHTAERREAGLRRIESYIEMPTSMRVAYQAASIGAVGFQLPILRELSRWQIDMLPEGPDANERADNSHRVVLQIEDRYRELVVDWCIVTGDPYELTARLVLAVARKVAEAASAGGWRTPADVLGLWHPLFNQGLDSPLIGCRPVRPLVRAAQT
ncbi:saccharopine dehydrogenase NADP-binding domain-containing protein [Variovorax sp. J2P1-59]|uniref:saccharopine dehydrogenase NADP-binding domain-containing protein n=1 Tax=Variovorax flavidus TaxID=3053501 RepID=UPI0025783023|nr:saccharopine dehydrogenase NADP-binding domain-containing protein [Variovorax sp. J2P1-59]MDM0077132.1 saccharopine dehydrogenase NADP-binding domain-containing protein [Variovorax sp. J2P1-59]